ncbi:MAG TPA: LemA family protein [Bacteroidales bacterium]|nr:LemA family protein [Bacteroidales bacterium]HOU95029.1 LemA family protein [Bacteroidales bacterium]HQG35730.1 LemA family protein [Bacteroidales bacterium]HQG53377.1 LemA family protein [Bacteroidales bacterium]HQJ19784.1 LemA family protein [Bacteroidales bacterium]
MALFIIFLVILLVLFLISVFIYNRLVRLRNNREQAFADIDVILRQRHDLVNQLVESVKGYMSHERGLLNEVTEARAGAIKAKTINEKIAAETKLSAALESLKVSLEAYPNLKANQNFMNLQNEITSIENKLAEARKKFNLATKELNVAVEMFPSNIIAILFNFKREPMFELGDEKSTVEQPPQIRF